MLARDGSQDKVFQIARQNEAGFRVLIADRDAMSSGLLADALVRELNCNAIGAQPSEVVRVLAIRPVDLLIVSADLNAKPRAGIELAATAASLHPDVPVVVLLDRADRDAVLAAFRAGARGVFNRQESIDRFLDCVQHVRKGLIWAGSAETGYILEVLRSIPIPGVSGNDDLATLTTRELQVVQCAARGQTNKTIAMELGLSEHTVKNYLFRAFDKLGISSRVELLFLLTARGRLLPRATPVQTHGAAD